MGGPMLGRLEALAPQKIWQGSKEDFTRWLADPEQMDAMGDALGLELETESAERSLGPFRADLICHDIGDSKLVLIQCDLSETDSQSLGRLVAHAAAVDAERIIWLAGKVTEEHRSAVDWLNRLSLTRVSFFAVELQLYRIQGSVPAPRFNVVAKPNDWARAARRGVRALETEALSDARLVQLDYWQTLRAFMQERGGPVKPTQKASPRAWQAFRLGRPGCHLSATLLRRDSSIRAEVALSGEEAEPIFRALEAEKQEIEAMLGYALEWNDLGDRSRARISISLSGADPENRTDWLRQHQWLYERLQELYRCFGPRIRALEEDFLAQEVDA